MKRDRVLDFWRGASIIMVIVCHCAMFRYREIFFQSAHGLRASHFPPFFWQRAFDLLFFIGPLGVHIFFAISGYLITKMLVDEESRAGSMRIGAFYFRRACRILPAYAAYVAFVFFAMHSGLIPYETGQIPCVLFLTNMASASCAHALRHTWSLAIEEQFYLLWPLILGIIVPRRRAGTTTLAIAVFTLMAMADMLTVDFINNARGAACIMAGALYALSPALRAAIRRYGGMLLLFVAVITALIFAFAPVITHIHPITAAGRVTTVLIPVAILIAVMTTYRFTRIVASPPFVLVAAIGRISYSLYLWQEIFLAPRGHYLRPSFLENAWLILPFAIASYFLIERPMIAWGRNGFSRKQA